jgi:hypothetical protein
VEQAIAGRPKDVVPAAEVDGGPIAATEGDRVAGLPMECRPCGTWAE